VEFESLNAAEGAGRQRWIEAGRPTVPSLVVDGETHPVLHVSQIAELLGLPAPAAGSPARDGTLALAILDAWLDRLREASWEALLEPTPSRGRTLRNLTVNVFHPFELLPAAWASGDFPWRPEDDGERERRLQDREKLLAWAAAAASTWRSFLDREDLAGRDPAVASPRGETRFSALVSFQHWHVAYHYRQLVHFLGVGDGGLLAGLALPLDVY
jgi:hypothetical protein